jgi:cell division protein FtsB
MPSHAELAAKLLRDAAAFFKTIAEQNPPLKEQMAENADVFEQVADLVEQNPTGIIEEE